MKLARTHPLLGAALAVVAAAGSAGTLTVEAPAPLGPVSSLARVVDARQQVVAMARPGEPVELPPGSYRVELLTDPPLVRKGIVVAAAGDTRVRFTELGGLSLKVVGTDGEPLATAADVFLADGRKVASIGSGAGETLVAGTYRVVLRTNPNQTFPKVVVAAGKVAELAVGLGATLELKVSGVSGKAVPARARFRHPDGSDLVIAAGETISLPPGRYDLVIDTVPPLRRSVDLGPASHAVVAVDDLGEMRFDLRDGAGRPVPTTVTLLEPGSGLVLARAQNGDVLAVRPGRYRVRFEGAGARPALTRDGVRVLARGTLRVAGKP